MSVDSSLAWRFACRAARWTLIGFEYFRTLPERADTLAVGVQLTSNNAEAASKMPVTTTLRCDPLVFIRSKTFGRTRDVPEGTNQVKTLALERVHKQGTSQARSCGEKIVRADAKKSHEPWLLSTLLL